MPDGWGEAIDFWANGWEPLSDEEREYVRKQFRTSRQIPRLQPFGAMIRDHWEPRFETRPDFVHRMRDLLTRQLDRYLVEAERQLEEYGFKKVPRKKARHHLTWLVQHRICGMSCEAIAERWAEENPQLESPPSAGAVAKAIRRTAEMIELD